MNKQIAVRIPDDLSEFIDNEVRKGNALNKASVITRALKREQRLALAAKDVEVLKASAPTDLQDLAEYATGQKLDLN